MELTGEYRIGAGRNEVWEALNDPAVLKECIPGCQELEKTSDTEMSAVVVSKVGPVKATFKGSVKLENLNPPESYSINGEGKGGVAGFAKGGADVKLVEDGDGTILNYTAKAQVGGKLAQLGSRLINSTAKKMADEFFGKFAAKFSPEGETQLDSELDDSQSQSSVSETIEETKSGAPTHATEEGIAEEKSLFEKNRKIIFWGLVIFAILVLILLVTSD